MECEGETPTNEIKKLGRKKKRRACEAYPESIWCAPCQNRSTRRPCTGPEIVEDATLVDLHMQDSTGAKQKETAVASELNEAECPRPVRNSAGKAPVFLEYPPNHLRDQRAHSYVAERKKTSAKPKISALQAELTASRTRLTLVEEKLRHYKGAQHGDEAHGRTAL